MIGTNCLNPFVSQVGFFDLYRVLLQQKIRRGLNPFVSQVGFFHLACSQEQPHSVRGSQSLRKSGRFLREPYPAHCWN